MPERPDAFIESIGEDPQVVRKALSDERVHNAFIESIREDPELIEVLGKLTPKTADVAAGWSCCRGNRPGPELEEIAESMRRRLKERGGE